MTRNSMILGSYPYMAPEQARRGERALRSNVYALENTWLELLLGDAPPPQEIGFGEYPQPTQRADVNAFIASMLKYRPDDRP